MCHSSRLHPGRVVPFFAVLALAGGCGSGERHPRGGSGPASTPHRSSHAPTTTSSIADPGLVVPTNYQEACANEGAVCVNASGAVPAVLNRPLHLPMLRPGERCPATSGAPISTAYFAGVALGNGPVRPLIASAGNLRHGIADLDPTDVPGWREFKTLWFSVPAYQGPFVIRAERVDRPGSIVLGGSGGLPTTVVPLVVPPGPTINGGGGWRTAPSGTWAKSPGCYAWQVDGLTFSEVIVVRAVLFPGLGRGGG
jgi:hypothetical protein